MQFNPTGTRAWDVVKDGGLTVATVSEGVNGVLVLNVTGSLDYAEVDAVTEFMQVAEVWEKQAEDELERSRR
jgi:hypothetical protein